MNTVSFTSEFVCNNLARKVVLGMEAIAKDNAKDFARGLIIPIAERITAGKVKRGALKVMLDRTVATLEAAPNVVAVDYAAATRKKLSANEQHHLTYILANAVTGDDDWVCFVCTEMAASRKMLSVNSTNADFRIHRHALARYMNREMKPTDDMFTGIADAVRAGVLLSHAVAENKNHEIAIPLRDGMLFGRIKLVNNAHFPSPKMKFTIDKMGPNFFEDTRRSLHHDRFRVMVEMMTYVDWNSLSQPRIELHRKISKMIQDHQFGITQCFNVAHYEQGMLEEDQHSEVTPSITAALEAARDLVRTPEWTAFAART
jgi:hypothetical protein